MSPFIPPRISEDIACRWSIEQRGHAAAARRAAHRRRPRHAGQERHFGDAPGLRHRQQQRPHPGRARPAGVHAAGALCVRPRHPLLRDIGLLRHAGPARRGAEGPAARQLYTDEQGDHRAERRSAEALRRYAARLADRVLRHHAAALAAHPRLGGRNRQLAGGHRCRRRRRRRSWRAARRCTACPRCARCRATSGSRWRWCA